jgi:hypothetical protein
MISSSGLVAASIFNGISEIRVLSCVISASFCHKELSSGFGASSSPSISSSLTSFLITKVADRRALFGLLSAPTEEFDLLAGAVLFRWLLWTW